MVSNWPSPKCFISYTWESSDHKSWVRKLATELMKNGVEVILDQWDLKYGHDLGHFMESAVRESSSVIIVCTPTYAKKADAGSGGAGYEKQIVTGELFQGTDSTKFIPLIRMGTDKEALPSFLKSKNYVDFRKDSEFAERLKDLLHQLHGVPKYTRPKRGPSPFVQREPTAPRDATSIPGLPPHLEEAMKIPKRTVRASGQSPSRGDEWDVEDKFDLEGGEYQPIEIEMEAGNRLVGFVEADGKFSAYLLGASSLRSFDEGLGFNYYWGKEDPVTYTKVSTEAPETRTYHFVVSNGYEDDEEEVEIDPISVEVKLRVEK